MNEGGGNMKRSKHDKDVGQGWVCSELRRYRVMSPYELGCSTQDDDQSGCWSTGFWKGDATVRWWDDRVRVLLPHLPRGQYRRHYHLRSRGDEKENTQMLALGTPSLAPNQWFGHRDNKTVICACSGNIQQRTLLLLLLLPGDCRSFLGRSRKEHDRDGQAETASLSCKEEFH